MDSIFDTETQNSNLSEGPNCSISFIKTECRVFSVKSNSPILPITWLLMWLAHHMASRSQWKMASIMISFIMASSIMTSSIAFTKMADSRYFWQKYTQPLPSIYTFFGSIFQKPLACIKNDIILHVYHNLKCNEKWWKAAYHASSVPRVVSYAPCVYVWCQTSEFCTILPGTLITGDIKKNLTFEIFSRPPDPTFWAACNRNQTIIFIRPNGNGYMGS